VEHQFRPGQSGNPKGRPKGRSITDALRKFIEQGMDNEADPATALAKVAMEMGIKGDHKFWTSILERVEGKIRDKHSLDVTVRVVYEEPELIEADERPMLEQETPDELGA